MDKLSDRDTTEPCDYSRWLCIVMSSVGICDWGVNCLGSILLHSAWRWIDRGGYQSVWSYACLVLYHVSHQGTFVDFGEFRESSKGLVRKHSCMVLHLSHRVRYILTEVSVTETVRYTESEILYIRIRPNVDGPIVSLYRCYFVAKIGA